MPVNRASSYSIPKPMHATFALGKGYVGQWPLPFLGNYDLHMGIVSPNFIEIRFQFIGWLFCERRSIIISRELRSFHWALKEKVVVVRFMSVTFTFSSNPKSKTTKRKSHLAHGQQPNYSLDLQDGDAMEDLFFFY